MKVVNGLESYSHYPNGIGIHITLTKAEDGGRAQERWAVVLEESSEPDEVQRKKSAEVLMTAAVTRAGMVYLILESQFERGRMTTPLKSRELTFWKEPWMTTIKVSRAHLPYPIMVPMVEEAQKALPPRDDNFNNSHITCTARRDDSLALEAGGHVTRVQGAVLCQSLHMTSRRTLKHKYNLWCFLLSSKLVQISIPKYIFYLIAILAQEEYDYCCSCCPCQCTCVPGLCPSAADQLPVEEISAADYIDEKKKAKPKLREDTETKVAVRRFAGFMTGIFLTTLYAMIVLFVKNYNLWFCLTSSVVIGFFLSLGMAFSLRVRVTVLLMLPQILSGEAKTVILFIAFTLVLQGPGANVVENIQRSTASMACGAELAVNETKELAAKITKPLMSALNALKSIGKKIRSATDSTSRFFRKFYDGLKHAMKNLRAVWAFIANIGDICNEELELPYIKCNKAFDEAKKNCFKVMSFMGFLCHILDTFRPLCGLAKIITTLCVIPDYVQGFVRKHVKNPILSVIRNFKDQFDFKISVIHDFDAKMNVSYYQISAAMIKELKEDVEKYMEMLSMFSYSMLFICIFTYIEALRYRKNYLINNNHDNIYITRDFIELDVMRAKQNHKTLLPLSSREAYGFIRPTALSLTKKEKKGYVFEIINVFRSFLVALLSASLDYLFFWVLDVVDHIMKGDIVTHAPVIFSMLVNGSGFTDDIYTTLVSAFEAIQATNITIQTTKCQIRPSEPNYREYVLIAFLHGFAFCIAIFGIYMRRLKRYICAYYYPTREQVRICFLYNKLLTKRRHVAKALFQSIKSNKVDKGHNSIMLILAAKCPLLCGWLAKYMGASEEYCMGCAQIRTNKNIGEFSACTTPGCKGMYCEGCSNILKNVCSLCMGPLLDNDMEDEEM
ncbi:DC-STAMP domain-containing protein 2 [Dendrobates tinctorius]|uniref:DC-STAMP domain-containing protein 2 n=1 Tax=Dendrobates tinctorius TaxID=92724 RepID=UPI003CC9335D